MPGQYKSKMRDCSYIILMLWRKLNIKVFNGFSKVIMLFADFLFSGRMFHSADEEISNKRLPIFNSYVPVMH